MEEERKGRQGVGGKGKKERKTHKWNRDVRVKEGGVRKKSERMDREETG